MASLAFFLFCRNCRFFFLFFSKFLYGTKKLILLRFDLLFFFLPFSNNNISPCMGFSLFLIFYLFLTGRAMVERHIKKVDVLY